MKTCKVCFIEKDESEFRERISEKRKEPYLLSTCRECERNKDRKRYKSNPEAYKEKQKKYRPIPKKKKLTSKKEYYHLTKNEPLNIITRSVRRRLKKYLGKFEVRKNNKTFEYVGCSPQELKKYIESLFTEGMCWENYGLFGWHIDHKIPLSSANTLDEMLKLNHYTNLQPLWWTDNLRKGKKL